MADTYQLTIRGLDGNTKQALKRRAAEQGMSINQLSLQALRRIAGIDEAEARFQRIAAILDASPMTLEDRKTFDEALAWSDAADKHKQAQNESNNCLVNGNPGI